MPFLSWSDKFSIDIEIVDEQHKMLFSLINTLYDLVKARSAGSSLSGALDALIDYTRYHFKEEEALMEKIEYVRFPQHKNEHDRLTGLAADFKNKMMEGNGNPDEFLDFLYNWLTKHIMEQDKKIGKFIEQKTLKTDK